MWSALHPIHKIAASQAPGRGTPAAVAEPVVRQEVLNGHLGDLGNGQLPLRPIRSTDDVSQRHSSRPGGGGRRRRLELVVLEVGLHRGKRRRRVVMERQVPEARELVAGERSQARRMGRRGDGSVVRGRRQRVMGEGGRGGSRGIGGVGP